MISVFIEKLSHPSYTTWWAFLCDRCVIDKFPATVLRILILHGVLDYIATPGGAKYQIAMSQRMTEVVALDPLNETLALKCMQCAADSYDSLECRAILNSIPEEYRPSALMIIYCKVIMNPGAACLLRRSGAQAIYTSLCSRMHCRAETP